MDPFDRMERDMLEDMRREFINDKNIPLSERMKYAKTTAALRWMDEFSNSLLQRMYRERAIKQRLANSMYEEFATRLASTSNVSAWLDKRGRTPEVVFLHEGHEVSLSISFRKPKDDEPVPLAWDIRPYACKSIASSPLATGNQPGNTLVDTDKGIYFRKDDHGEPTPFGGARFFSTSGPVETAYDVFHREHKAGTDPDEAGRIANSAVHKPLHRFAPTLVQLRCWCGKSRHTKWAEILRRVERSLRPGHVRVEDKRIVATLPIY